MFPVDALRYIGKTFYDYFIQAYSESPSSQICLLLDDDTFYTTVSKALPNLEVSESVIKDFYINYNKMFHLEYNNNNHIALALIVYQIKCCTTAEALDEASIIQSIADGYNTDKQSISSQYFKSGNQKRLWDTVNKLFNNRLLMPPTPIPLGKSGCNVQYPKLHRIFSSSELTCCKKKIFPYITDVTTFSSFKPYSLEISNILWRSLINDSELFVIYKLYCYWVKHRKEYVKVSHINHSNNIELRISLEDSLPSIIDKDGRLVSSQILGSELIDDILFFYYDTDFYSTQKKEESDFIAVLLNKHNALFRESINDTTFDAIFSDNTTDYSFIFLDEKKFRESQFANKIKITTHDFFFKDGIQISRNEYIQGYLPIIECTKPIQELVVSAIGNSSYKNIIKPLNNEFNLNTISYFLSNSGFVKFKISSANSNRTFSILSQKNSFEGNIGWNFTDLTPIF